MWQNGTKALTLVLEKKIGESRNYFSEEIEHNDLMSEMYKKCCILN